MDLNLIITIIFFITFVLTIGLAYFDYKNKRKMGVCPFISFIVPSYNDGATIQKTIESIFKNCHCKFELFVINDGSKDNTLDVLKDLNKKYNVNIINNKVNMGKSRSINNTFGKTKGNIIFIVDSDVIVNRAAIEDVISRLNDSSNVGAVGGKYKSINSGFLEFMQDLEYNMTTILQASYNHTSTISLCGGFLAVKREAFEKVGMFSENMITEDIDLAFKLNEAGYKVQQSFKSVYSLVPSNIGDWIKQKIRWSSGGFQCYLKHIKVWIRNPLILLFFFSYSIIIILSLLSLLNGYQFGEEVYLSFKSVENNGWFSILKYLNLLYGAIFLKTLLYKLSFSLTAVPYFIMMNLKLKEYYKILSIIPYTLIYFPALIIVSIPGFFIGTYRYITLKEQDRAW